MALTTFTLVQRALDASEHDPDHAGLRADIIIAGRVRKAVQTVVDCLVDPAGGKYEVSFADISTAATSLGKHQIIVSSKPLTDGTLSLVEKAVVIATFAAHEIGHTLVTKPRGSIVKDHNPRSGYHAVANVSDDIILEPHMADLYPILKDAFEFTGLWVLRTTRPGKTVENAVWETTPDRFNTILSATRYGDIPEIVWANARAVEERDWARAWKRDLLALRLRDDAGFIAQCDILWERIRTIEEPPIEDEPTDEPEPGEDEGEPEPDDEGEPTGPGGDEPGEDTDEDDEDDEPTDEGGDDEGGTEPTDEPGGDDEGGDEPTDDGGDEPGNPTGDIKDPNDQPRDWDDGREPKPSDKPSEPDENPVDDGKDEKRDPNRSGGGGTKDTDEEIDPPALRDEDDFDTTKVDETTHDSAEEAPYGENAEAKVRTYENTTRTAFTTHGAMTTEWS